MTHIAQPTAPTIYHRTPADLLSNSRYLDLTRHSPSLLLHNALQELLTLVPMVGQHKLLETNLHILLVNLIRLQRHSPTTCLFFPRSHAWWKTQASNPLNPMGASRKMINVVDTLIEAGWLQHYEGYHNRLGKKGGDNRKNVWSRLAILQPIADFIQRNNLISIPVTTHEDRPLIMLSAKDASEEETPRLQTAKPKTMPIHVKQSEKVLERYNTLLNQQSLGLSCDTTGVFTDATQVYRIFNRNSFNHGGRVYGGWWMQVNKDKRRHITINGQPTIELDYKGQHPNLLYAQANLPLPADPYDIPDLPRKLAKAATMVMLNSNSPQTAFKALHQQNVHDVDNIEAELDGEWMHTYEVYEYRDDYLSTYQQFEQRVAIPILTKHKAIADSFYTDQGTLLMNLDARICLYVLEHMTAQGIPCLSIHDSFLVTLPHEDTLKVCMTNAYKSLGLTHGAPPISVTLPIPTTANTITGTKPQYFLGDS